MLYWWLIDERMTIRQLLNRLTFAAYYPRSGAPIWARIVSSMM
jgi:site-specific DNA recombinase